MMAGFAGDLPVPASSVSSGDATRTDRKAGCRDRRAV